MNNEMPSFFTVSKAAVFLALLFLSNSVCASGTEVFINELHYDNTGTDSGEFVEIAGPIGTNLSGWSLVPYNGSGGAAYSTTSLSGTLPVPGVIAIPILGLQNGAPDGVALVDHTNAVVQFLSYEGSFTATDGPANGMLSVDIGFAELSDTPVGHSLQLSGSGQVYEDFYWAAPQPDTAGSINTGQVFDAGSAAALVINEIDYDQPGTDLAEFIEIMNAGSAAADLTGFQVVQINGANGATTTIATLPTASLAPNDYYVICGDTGLVPNCDLVTPVSSDLVQNGSPDAVALFDDLALVIDTVSYEGAVPGYTEGSGSGLEDAAADGSISRCPDGADTDQNNIDFRFTATISPGAQNECSVVVEECGDPTTPIHDIQGSGLVSGIVGSTVSIEGIVVGDFQDGASKTHGDLDGFYVQQEDIEADVDENTSEGIFIFDGSSPTLDVQAGDRVRVSGTVNEISGLTQIGATTFVAVCAQDVGLPSETEVTLPVATLTDFEKYEGMLVTLPSAVISEYANFDRYGEIRISPDRLYQPTSVFDPGSPEATDLATLNAMSQIALDDGRTVQNPDPAIHPNGAEFDLDNRFRGGDILENVTGVMDYRFDLYRIQPTQGALHIESNLRTAQPAETGGGIRVATFNLLNYFNGDGLGGGFPTSRGADTLAEFTRQRDKILAALLAIDADVVGVVEIENDGYGANSAIQDLVNGLNDATAPNYYDFVDPGVGVIGTDEIAVGLIYKPSTVGLTGDTAILDSSVDPNFLDTKNRPALAQTFVAVSSSEAFTVVVNHLKSKGSSCDDVGDPDTGDGSGNCNLTRAKAAQALVTWLAGDPTSTGDPDFLIIGDLNAYDKEDPIDTFTAGGYTDLLTSLVGEFAYTFLFDAQLGHLDYVLASSELTGQVTGVTAWHFNADEPDLINYDTTFKLPAQQAIYAPDAYRSSDHDAVIVGLDLGPRLDLIFRNGFESD